jgi:hypothetical protein
MDSCYRASNQQGAPIARPEAKRPSALTHHVAAASHCPMDVNLLTTRRDMYSPRNALQIYASDKPKPSRGKQQIGRMRKTQLFGRLKRK